MSDERGWFFPSTARKAHFDGGDGRALCGKRMRVNPLTGRGAPIQGGADDPPSPDDCVECRRRLAKEVTAP